ncbi:Hypothetical predicted protein [Paramuricea clavata]|uniref:Uncharacterized protein n=1 Tax=Paramuricea clavata TaxID=317549 RepID=A0A6S7GQ27_PARCT|nr:Hypothetical predicted protein [Paramuricea clavata]
MMEENDSNSDTSECTISSITLTPEEVHHVLAAIDENKATGPDKIPAKLLKNCASSIYLSLCDLFNKSLSLGKLPNEWKLSNIVPIPKKGPAEELLHVLQDIHQALESRNQVDAVYLDFAKAFDKVSHKLLLTKLHKFGIRGDLLSWFENYLSGRYQRVTVLGETSGTLPVLSGVPQGSILGLLLFLVYANDLPHSISGESTVAMFADDTKCYRPVKDLSDCESLQNDLNNRVNWCTIWKMDLNKSKCGVMSFTRSRQPVTTNYKLLDSSLKQLCHQKDLGIVVTKDLKWTKQVEEIISKASSMLGFIRRTASDTHNIHVRKVLYLSLVRSKLGYASQNSHNKQETTTGYRYSPSLLLARISRLSFSLQEYSKQRCQCVNTNNHPDD